MPNRRDYPRIHVARAKGVTAVWLLGDFESVCLADSEIPRCALADAVRLLRSAIRQCVKEARPK